jgi:hypothetical protein
MAKHQALNLGTGKASGGSTPSREILEGTKTKLCELRYDPMEVRMPNRKFLYGKNKYCSIECAKIAWSTPRNESRKVERPSREELNELLRSSNYSRVLLGNSRSGFGLEVVAVGQSKWLPQC